MAAATKWIVWILTGAVLLFALWYFTDGGVARAGGDSFRRKWKIVEVRRAGVSHVATWRTKGGEFCRAETVGADGKNLLGGVVATVWSRTRWCGNWQGYSTYEKDHWINFHGAFNPWHVDKKFSPVVTNNCCTGSPGYWTRRVRYEFQIEANCIPVVDWCTVGKNFGTLQRTAYSTPAFYHEDVFG